MAGHTKCGGIGAALTTTNYGPLEHYLSEIRHLRNVHATELNAITDTTARTNRLVELNVAYQVMNVAASQFAQKKWNSGGTLRVHGVVYSLDTGIITNLGVTIDSLTGVDAALRLY